MSRINNVLTEENNSAIVIGGSITGLIAARVLIEHFDRVTMGATRSLYREARISQRRASITSPVRQLLRLTVIAN